MSRTESPLAWLALAAALSTGCDDRTLTRIERLGPEPYPAGRPFSLVPQMTDCSDPCATYHPGACAVKVDEQARKIELAPIVTFTPGRSEKEACLNCGAPIFVECKIMALRPGTYMVEGPDFAGTITVN